MTSLFRDKWLALKRGPCTGEGLNHILYEKIAIYSVLVVLGCMFNFSSVFAASLQEVEMPVYAEEEKEKDYTSELFSRLKTAVISDHKNFYSQDNLLNLGIGLSSGCILANTSLDSEFQVRYQKDFHISDLPGKSFGEGEITLPVFATAALVGELMPDYEPTSVIGEWGRRTLRAYLVGVPPLLALQRATGGSRPHEKGDDSSHWRPLEDSNGVSGHAFMGAVPFMTAAKMTDNLFLKFAFYAGSGLCAWTRINDDDHYLSQVLVGTWLAYNAVSSVEKTGEPQKIVVTPLVTENAVGAVVTLNFNCLAQEKSDKK